MIVTNSQLQSAMNDSYDKVCVCGISIIEKIIYYN